MSAATRSPELSDWRALAELGEQLVGTTSLTTQRDRIINMTRRLVAGKVDVWLQEGLFRLPDHDEEFSFRPNRNWTECVKPSIRASRFFTQLPKKIIPTESALPSRLKTRG